MKIGIIGAPGVGKSTITTGLYHYLKLMRKNVEFIPELIKFEVYGDIDFNEKGFDINNSREQKKLEDKVAKGLKSKKISYLLTESPLTNGYFYSTFYKKKMEIPILRDLAQERVNNYEYLIFVKQALSSDTYVDFGRKESFEESLRLENHISKKLKKLGFENKIIECNMNTPIFEIIEKMGIGAEEIHQMLEKVFMPQVEKYREKI